MRSTQNGKILSKWVQAQASAPQRFFFGYEFIGTLGAPDFVGYKAPTRFCEMCLDYPDMIESHEEGKYRVGRLRFENASVFLKKLPADMALLVFREMREAGVSLEGVDYSPVKETVRI